MLFIHLRTIFSFAFYHRLSFVKKGVVAAFGVYLFLLSVLIVCVTGNSRLNKIIPFVLRNFPEVTFEKGVLISPEYPVSLVLPDHQLEVVFDASPKAVLPSPNASIPLVWVNKNQLYVLANGQMQTQLLPTELSFTTSQENLQKYQATISASLKISLFIVSLFFIALIMFFSFCLAFATGLVLKIIKNIPISYSLLAKWSFFLLGPLSVLWYLRLWVAIPLFSLAQLILCIIYMQQIFNLIPEVRPHAH